MIDKNEKVILKVIKYFPPILILVITITTSIISYKEHKKNIINEKILIEKQYLDESKKEIKNLIEIVYKLVEDTKNDQYKNLKKDLKNRVYNAHALISTIVEKYENHKSKEEIIELIKDSLRNIRFNEGRSYFFIYEMKGTNIMNSEFPNLEGKNLWNYKDIKGTPIIKEMNKILKSKSETFYEWYWQKEKNNDEYLKKVGFFKKFESYNWFIGTGEYIDKFSENIKNEMLSHISNVRYKDGNYIFITNKDGKILANKYHNLIGKNVKDFEGEHLSQGFKNLEKLKNGLFIEYKLDKKSILEDEKKKVSYIKLNTNLDWVMGTGFDLKNANLIIKERQKLLEKKYNTYLKNYLITGSVVMLLLLIISNLLSKYIQKIFFKYKSDLEKNHQILIRAQETAHIGDWRLDLETMEAYWSDEILKILGIKNHPKKLGPEYLKTIMYKEDWKCFEDSMNNTIKNNAEHICTYRVTRPNDGKMVWVDCRGKKSPSGKHIYGTIQDITKRKLLEEEKENHEALLYQQSKMAAMGEMIGNIAHQWRQPLSIISTAATGAKVQNEIGILNSQNINSYFDTINHTAQNLSQTIEDFRTFFDPKENELKIFTINNAIEKTLNLTSAQFTSRNITIIKNIEDIDILSLENELIQALVNILNNSRDALLEVNENQEKLIFINAKRHDNETSIQIYDNAGGIPIDIIDRIFEPYFTTKHKSQGTGIGLYMTRQIITKLLKASITAENIKFSYNNTNYSGALFKIVFD